MNLLIFFALPLATILLSIVLEKILKSPILVAITFFSIYLIIIFALFATGTITNLAEFLIAIIIYTILAFITAYIIRILRCICEKIFNNLCNNSSRFSRNNEMLCDNEREDERTDRSNNLLRISCKCNNGNTSDLLTVDSNCLLEENNCNCSRNNDRISLNGNIVPNQINGGRTGTIRGCYRRY